VNDNLQVSADADETQPNNNTTLPSTIMPFQAFKKPSVWAYWHWGKMKEYVASVTDENAIWQYWTDYEVYHIEEPTTGLIDYTERCEPIREWLLERKKHWTGDDVIGCL
jgi:hypothetical protein